MNATKSKERLRNEVRDGMRTRYDQLWTIAIERIRSGQVELDPVLCGRQPDKRRGLTVIARPPSDVRQRVAEFLGEFSAIEPDQYYYDPSEFHVTVLSLFSATAEFGPFYERLDQFITAVDKALAKAAPFDIEFAGVTASPAAILIQGFLADDKLNGVRDALRAEIRRLGLGDLTDTRYRLETAHMTVARFRAPLRESARLAALLERTRATPFGVARIGNLSLVKNDWYMSRQNIEVEKTYTL